MCCLSPPGFADGRDGAAQHQDSVNSLVLGCLPDDHRQTRHFGAAIAATTGVVSLRDHMDDAPQVSPGVDTTREPLWGDVEVDETWVGGQQAGLRGSRQLKGRKAALVIVAVEKRGKASGRLRMAVIPDFKSVTLNAFVRQNVAPGSTIYTDGLKSFTGFEQAGSRHIPRAQPLQTNLRKGAKSVVPLADRTIGNLQQWLTGTYHGVSREQLQVYLDEFVFRHNRRKHPMAAFQHCWASGPDTNPRPMSRYGAQAISGNYTPNANHNMMGLAETTG